MTTQCLNLTVTYKYTFTAPIQLIHTTQNLSQTTMAEPGERGRGRGRAHCRGGKGGGRRSRKFLWGAGAGPDMYDHPLDNFPIEGIEDFVGGRKLRPYNERNESWPQCKCGQSSVMQMFDDFIDGGRHFFRCPFGYVRAPMAHYSISYKNKSNFI
jgi:hypothetical protein